MIICSVRPLTVGKTAQTLVRGIAPSSIPYVVKQPYIVIREASFDEWFKYAAETIDCEFPPADIVMFQMTNWGFVYFYEISTD